MLKKLLLHSFHPVNCESIHVKIEWVASHYVTKPRDVIQEDVLVDSGLVNLRVYKTNERIHSNDGTSIACVVFFMVSGEVDISRTPCSLGHSKFAEHNFIKPDYRLVGVPCLFKLLNDFISISREMSNLVSCPSLLQLNGFAPDSMLNVQISKGCLRNQLMRKLGMKELYSITHRQASPFHQCFS